MNLKINSKLFATSIGALALTPLLSSCAPIANSKVAVSSENGADENPNEACTITYIGAECTPDGNAIIARATDCNPKAVHLKLKHFKADEKANQTVVGSNGLTYTYPEHTFAYTSCPMSPQTADDPIWGSGLWENNAINEKGVCVTCTLTCASRPEIIGEEGIDKFNPAGIGEELLTAIIAPSADTARKAMQIAADAIETYGNQDENIIMACDPNEAWLMEMYSGSQYCAVKLPRDKVCVAGNEFILDSLDDLGINASNVDDMCIKSENLLKLVQDNNLAVFKSGQTPMQEDIYHLDLFHSYARPLTWTDAEGEHNTDTSHMRTWRGYSLFDKYTQDTKEYDYTRKYPAFLIPKDELGKVRNDLTAYDVMEVYRDEFDELVEGPQAQQRFVDAKEAGTLRPIAVQTTRAVHIMSSDHDTTHPIELAANEWYTPSSGNYTPFLQLNSGMTSVDGEYGYYPDRFDFDEDCSSVLFRELNKLAWYDRKNYGYPIQDFWREFEKIYCTQMTQVVNEAKELPSLKNAQNIITNFNKHVRDIYIQAVKDMKDDLLWFILDQPSTKHPTFIPLIDLENYVTEMGWTNYKFDGEKATFERNGTQCEYTVSDGKIYAQGVLKVDGNQFNLRDSIKNGKVFVDLATLNQAIKDKSEIRTINIKDYLIKFNHLVWIIPTVIVVAAGIGIATYFIIKKKKQPKQNPNPQ